MKRQVPWKDRDESSSSSSSSDSDPDADETKKGKKFQGKFAKRKSDAIDFESLRKHGYKGGLSVLNVPPPKDDVPPQDWTWSTGEKHRRQVEEKEESFKEREKTRGKLMEGELVANVQTSKKNLSFSQKEKRKRDLGQTSRGKNYVEEEKRLLRESGIYSTFDN